MATKKGNGHDPQTEQMVAVLQRIEKRAEEAVQALGIGFAALRNEVQATNARLDALTVGVHDFKLEMRAFKDETREELCAIHADVASIDNNLGSVRTEALADIRQYDARIRRLEEAVFKPAAS